MATVSLKAPPTRRGTATRLRAAKVMPCPSAGNASKRPPMAKQASEM